MIFDQMQIDIFYRNKFVFPKVYTSSHKTYAIITPNIATWTVFQYLVFGKLRSDK